MERSDKLPNLKMVKKEKNSDMCETSEFEEVSEVSGSEEFEFLDISKSEESEKEKDENKEKEICQILKKWEMKLLETLKYKDFINNVINVKTIDKNIHIGLLECLDPNSGDMIIANVQNECIKTLLFQASCVSVTLSNE